MTKIFGTVGSLVIQPSSAKGSRKFTLRSKACHGKEPEMPWMLPKVLCHHRGRRTNLFLRRPRPRFKHSRAGFSGHQGRSAAEDTGFPLSRQNSGNDEPRYAALSVPRVERVAQTVADAVVRQPHR